MGQPSVWEGLHYQVFLGSERFVERFAVGAKPLECLREVPRAQRRPLAKSLGDFEQTYPVRREAMARAFLTGVYPMQAIAEHFGVPYSTVNRAVRWLEGSGNLNAAAIEQMSEQESGMLDGKT